jgi:hypothetical protein
MCCADRNFAISGLAVPAGLRLENYVVIDNVGIEFTSGLALLTGKTGAGKLKVRLTEWEKLASRYPNN